MRKLALVIVVLGWAGQALAAKVVTAAQVEQMLTQAQAKNDAGLARQIAELQLNARMSAAQLERLKGEAPGEQTKKALIALADGASFLALPVTELPSKPAPEVAEQRRIMGLVATYVSKTIPQLPNFFATRVTTRYEDTPLLQDPVSGFLPYEPMHFLNASTATVLYRDGREVVDADGAKQKPQQVTAGLNTWGVFGPILGTVLVDAAQSKLVWSHWEQGADGLEAVFSYDVPKEKSHYEVNYCCVAEQAATASASVHPFRQLAGYHGEMAVDPSTGTIIRLTVEADMKTGDPVVKAGIVVEYGAVEIGGKKYICPVRSVSSTLAQTLQVDSVYKFAVAHTLQPLKNSLSDVRFEQYHVFRAESHVVTGDRGEAETAGNGVKTPPQEAAAVGAANATVAADKSNSASTQTGTNGDAPAADSVPAVAPAPEPVVAEISDEAGQGMPEMGGDVAAAADPGFTLKSTTRLVDVSVVAFDKKGKPITDLKPEDFEIYDNGSRQKVRFYSQASADGAAVSAGRTGAPKDSVPEVYSNRRAAEPSAGVRVGEAEGGTTILLIDSSSLAWGDLTYARAEMLRFLKSLPAGERVGLCVLNGLGFQVLMEPSADHALLAASLSKWMPAAQDLARAQDEEQRNRQQFDWVHQQSDLAYVNGKANTNPENSDSPGAPGASVIYPVDADLRDLGSNPERDALGFLVGLARHLAALPGHKSLVWVASDNVLADWSNLVLREETTSKDLDPLFLHAQESLNDAHVSIYPLDASQLEAGSIGADIRNRNVNAVGYTSRSRVDQTNSGPVPGMSPGRDIARMQQDTHGIQGGYRELAEATGGRAMRRASDIAAELNSVVSDGRAVYQLSFSPDMAADDKYHLLTVKIRNRSDIKLRYRTGYMYSKEPTTMKARFQLAIVQPRDTGEIGVSVTPVIAAKGFTLKVIVAASDLALKQEGGRWTDKLDIFVVERDDAALHAKLNGHRVGLRLKPGTYQQVLHDGIQLVQPVESPIGSGSARVVVVDENSGRIGSVTIPASARQPGK
jgi:VWFA-related protein